MAIAAGLALIDRPLITAKDQPPPPGSHWVARGWHVLRRGGASVLDVLPRRASVPMLVLRLVAVVLVWLVIAVVALEVLYFYAIFVALPRAVLRRRQPASQPVAPTWGGPATGSITAGPYQYVDPKAELRRRLATAPLPQTEAAINACPNCGASIPRYADACSYCRSQVPVLSGRGWHPDPLGGPGRRFFDGTAWTEFELQPS